MISKLPRWVEAGAFLLAGIAGFVNAVGLLGFEHQAVSHLSGTATIFGISLLDLHPSDSLHLLGILLSFFLGASLSGFLLHDRVLRMGRHYEGALVLEGLFLLTAWFMLDQGSTLGHYFASAACGLQNALATTYSGAIVRTTHLTGIFTDLGIMLGSRLRGQAFDRRKGLLFLIIITGFIVGGTGGALAFRSLAFEALIIPGVVTLLLALSYRIYRVRVSR